MFDSLPFFVKFCWRSFFGGAFVTSIISSHVITESPIILPKYFTSSKVRDIGFQI